MQTITVLMNEQEIWSQDRPFIGENLKEARSFGKYLVLIFYHGVHSEEIRILSMENGKPIKTLKSSWPFEFSIKGTHLFVEYNKDNDEKRSSFMLKL